MSDLNSYENAVGRNVLCVDDDPFVLKALQRELRRHFDVDTADTPQHALPRIEQHGPYPVIIADYTMPGMNGSEFFKEVHQRTLDSVCILLTGHVDLHLAIEALHEGRIFRILEKPCRPDLLVRTVQDAFHQHELILAERRLKKELNQANAELQALNRELEARVEMRTSAIQEIYDFVSALHGMTSIHQMAQAVVRMAAQSLNCQCACLRTSGARHDPLPCGAAESGETGEWNAEESLNVRLRDMPTCESCAAQDDTENGFHSHFLLHSHSASEKDILCRLSVSHPVDNRPLAPEARQTLQLIGNAAATAIQNQIRIHERNEARDAVILALAKLAEHRDPETGAHLERVQQYCRILSRDLATHPSCREIIDEEFIETIVRSSPLHDIGKVGVPDRILLKPGTLTPEEFEIMKNHTLIGGNTIASLMRQSAGGPFLQMGMEIALAHHEKYDGSGYPKGLSGEDIPLAARILTLADVYDALTSQRAYKDALSHARARDLIVEGRGTHFDPLVVDSFLRQENAFASMREALSDDVPRPADNDLADVLMRI